MGSSSHGSLLHQFQQQFSNLDCPSDVHCGLPQLAKISRVFLGPATFLIFKELVNEPDDGTCFYPGAGLLSFDYLTEMVRGYVDASGIEKRGACQHLSNTMAT
jgi:hypothetical protein